MEFIVIITLLTYNWFSGGPPCRKPRHLGLVAEKIQVSRRIKNRPKPQVSTCERKPTASGRKKTPSLSTGFKTQWPIHLAKWNNISPTWISLKLPGISIPTCYFWGGVGVRFLSQMSFGEFLFEFQVLQPIDQENQTFPGLLLSKAKRPNSIGYLYHNGVIAISIQSFTRFFFAIVPYLIKSHFLR